VDEHDDRRRRCRRRHRDIRHRSHRISTGGGAAWHGQGQRRRQSEDRTAAARVYAVQRGRAAGGESV